MNIRPKAQLRQATRILLAAMPEEVHARLLGGEPDAVIELKNRSGTKTHVRLVPWGQAGVIARRDIVVWVLRQSNRRLRESLRARDENFVDLAGAVRLHLPWMYIDRADLSPAAIERTGRVTRNPFSDRGSLVTRTLLETAGEKAWTVRELSAAAGVSLGLTSYVVRELVDRHLASTHRIGNARQIQIVDPLATIERWTREYDWRSNTAVAFLAPVGSPGRFLRRLSDQFRDLRWALGLHAGASLIAPHATWDLIHIYVDVPGANELDVIARQLGWEAGDGGKVVLMAPYYRKSAWHGVRTLEGLPVVSTVQLILDLWHYPVRGREQAEQLIDRALPAEQSRA